MSNQTYKKALKHLEKIGYLVASIRTWQPSVNERLSDGATQAPGSPDWNHVQEWCITQLEDAAEDLRQADRDHREQRILLQHARLERDRRLGELETGQRSLRRSFSGVYGRKSLPLVGLEEEPARAKPAAREQIRQIVDLLRDPQTAGSLPDPEAGQTAIALEPLADFWAEKISALENQMDKVDRLNKQTQEAMIERDHALKLSRRVYSNAGRVLEGIYRFARLDALADRLRLTEPMSRKGDESSSQPELASSHGRETDSLGQSSEANNPR